MSDPYNSYGSHTPVAPPAPVVTAAARPPRDNITRLDVSEAWKRKFRLIEKAGGPDMPNLRSLPSSERSGLHFNFLAFFFGPFYFLAKGLWRQAASYFLIGFVLIVILELMGLDSITRAVGYGFSAVYAVRANVSYYRLMVLGDTPWL